MSRDVVQAAHYGLGAFFPVVVLDPEPRWRGASPLALPERSPGADGLLALRWCGFDDEADEAGQLLEAAAARAPRNVGRAAQLAAYAATLPRCLRLVALPRRALVGPWVQRPGRDRC